MQLGPLQQMWAERLKNHPEKQGKKALGYRTSDGDYQACCLGELLLCYYRKQRRKLPSGQIKCNGDVETLLDFEEKLGLYSDSGDLQIPMDGFSSLAEMNDNGYTWPEIAEFVEENPELVFDKSV